MPNANGRRRAPARHRGNAGRELNAKIRKPEQRADPRSELDQALAAAAELPYPPVTTFGQLGLDDRLVRVLAARGITVPFAIQARALPDALVGRDVLGRAETGSGKTLAFGLPMLSRIAVTAGLVTGGAGGGRRREKAPRGLVLVPTRELAGQVAEVLRPLARSLGLLVTTVYGGVSIGRQIDRLQRGVDIVVATPGRLTDLLDRRACTLADIDVTVLDEADHMADLGFLPSVTRIMDQTPAGGQRLLYSATLDRGVDRLVQSYLSDPALHAVAPEAGSGSAAEHSLLVLDAADKVAVAAAMASRPARTLFFVRTRHGADRLAKQLGRAGVPAGAIHGDRNQNQRQRSLDAFAAGHPRVLVATDVAARGIHVDDVELVVHFDPPNDHKDYLHRSGRTARAGATGLVVTLALREQVRELQQLYAAAQVAAVRHDDVHAGHPAVTKIAVTGMPVPPPAVVKIRPRPADAPPRVRRRTGRPSRAASQRRPAGGQGRPAAAQNRQAAAQSRPSRRPRRSA